MRLAAGKARETKRVFALVAPGAAQALLSFQRHEEPGLCLIAARALEDVLPA